jgi:hypothetical protein
MVQPYHCHLTSLDSAAVGCTWSRIPELAVRSEAFFSPSLPLSLSLSLSLSPSLSVCVCVCVWSHTQTNTHGHIHSYIHTCVWEHPPTHTCMASVARTGKGVHEKGTQGGRRGERDRRKKKTWKRTDTSSRPSTRAKEVRRIVE